MNKKFKEIKKNISIFLLALKYFIFYNDPWKFAMEYAKALHNFKERK